MIRISVRKKLNLSNNENELRVNATISTGQITALYGPSGAGKTSLLKMLAGLMTPDGGTIEVNGSVWFNADTRINIPPQKRNIGFVFQDYALFPNMTVRQNLRYAAAKKADEQMISHLLETTQLADFAQLKPQTLSGGQQQRVALARAIVRKPDLLLLDEPLSALDHQARLMLQDELLQLQQEYQFTVILVSHDVAEICRLASHVIKIDNGAIINQGTPAGFFASPTDNMTLTGQVINVDGDWLAVLIGGQIAKFQRGTNDYQVGDYVVVEINPQSVTISRVS